MKKIKIALWELILLGCGMMFAADANTEPSFTVFRTYGNHMVLQQGRPIRIGGTAVPGTVITVNMDDADVSTRANENGVWTAVLPEKQAGGPFEITISSEGQEVIFSDVLVGEVWMCSGQSNMQMPVFSESPFWRTANYEEEVANANYPEIRLFLTGLATSPMGPLQDIAAGEWQVCSPESVKDFSAVGYFFGRELYRDLDVPIGLVDSSWGGTAIQSWISEEGYRTAERSEELEQIEDYRQKVKGLPADKEAMREKLLDDLAVWMDDYYAFGKDIAAEASNWSRPEYDDSSWTSEILPSQKTFENVIGVIQFRRVVTIPAEFAGKDLFLEIGAIDDYDQCFWDGELIGKTGIETDYAWRTPRKYLLPAAKIKNGTGVLTIRVINVYSAGGINGEIRLTTEDGLVVETLSGEWKSKIEFVVKSDELSPRPMLPEQLEEISGSPHIPSTLYNAMIAPWTRYPMRGTIWYQGENNAWANWEDYVPLQKLQIADWRTQWDDPEFAFCLTQLSAFEAHRPLDRLPDNYMEGREPADEPWARLREVQAFVAETVPDTGMAVTIDVGDHSDIHPRDKQTVGYRLAKEAERICYGEKGVTSGPRYRSMRKEGNALFLTFDHCGSGLEAKGKLGAFAIAGSDGKYYWADAEIIGNEVKVSSPMVETPEQVRYGWNNFPVGCNLYNKEGFAASPFQTEKPDYLQ